MDYKSRGGRSAGSTVTIAALLGLAAVGVLTKRPAEHQPESSPSSAAPSGSSADANRPAVAVAAPIPHEKGIVGLGKSIVERISRDNITLVAAGIAFYVMLAIFPALAMIVSLYALFGDPADVARRIQDYSSLLPPESMKLITDGLNSFAKKSSSQLSFALLLSVLLALWSARAGISSMMTGLNIAYEETEKRSFIVQNLVALGMTIAGVFFAIVIFIAVPVVPIVLSFLHIEGLAATLVDLLRWPVVAFFVALGFAFLYRYAPSRSHPRWRWISWGSAIATLCWLIGSVLFSVYVSRFGSYDATYGSLGAVVVLLLWFWVSALVLLVGAEIDAELDTRATATSSPFGGLAPSSGPPGQGVTAKSAS